MLYKAYDIIVVQEITQCWARRRRATSVILRLTQSRAIWACIGLKLVLRTLLSVINFTRKYLRICRCQQKVAFNDKSCRILNLSDQDLKGMYGGGATRRRIKRTPPTESFTGHYVNNGSGSRYVTLRADSRPFHDRTYTTRR